MTSYRIHNNQAAISLTLAVCIFKITLADQVGLSSYQSDQNENSREIKPEAIDYIINDMTTEQNMFENFPDEQQDIFQSNQFANSNNKSVYKWGESVVDLGDSTTSISDGDSIRDNYQQEAFNDPANEQEFDTKSVLFEHPGHSLLKHRAAKLKRQMKHKNRKHNHKLRYRSGHRAYDTPSMNAHISYYNDDDGGDNENNDDPMTIDYRPYNRNHAKSYSQDKWPNLQRLQNQLSRDEEDEHLPPYIKKYKKRNKQLLDLLEGTLPPPYASMKPKVIGYYQKRRQYGSHHHHRQPVTHKRNHRQQQRRRQRYHNAESAPASIQKIESNQVIGEIRSDDEDTFKWTIGDLFGEQMANNNDNKDNENRTAEKEAENPLSGDVQTTTRHPNELPSDSEDVISAESQHNAKNNHKLKIASENRMSPRTEDFIYHRVASPKLVGFSGGGGIKKRLPFVAITDRRLSRKRSNSNSMEQNQMP